MVAVALAACGSGDPRPPDWAANVAPAEVLEAGMSDGRQLLRVHEDRWAFWASVPADVGADVGDHLWLGKGPAGKVAGHDVIVIDQARVATPAEVAAFEVLDPPADGASIEAVYADRAALAGRPVAVRGRVVKAAYDIFGTNWYHLRDGTGDDGTNDLTVTSHTRAVAGAVLEARGSLTVDKDLGFGYFYPAIIEDAEIVVE
ncbi:MAG: hypothetical protein ABMB14_28230 [Myxococcota bacterium]